MSDDKTEQLKSLSMSAEARAAAGEASRSSLIPVLATVVVMTALAAAAWFMFGGGEPSPDPIDADPARAVVASTPTPSAAQETQPAPAAPATRPERRSGLIASGYVVARRAATVSADIQGRLLEVNFDEGSVVEDGQILARLDDELAQIDLSLARSRAEVAEATAQSIAADLDEARSALERTRQLVANRFTSEAQMDIDRARVDSLEARLRGARAEADAARYSADRAAELVDRHIVRAPFAGVVIAKNAQAGEILSPASAGGGFTRTGVATLVDMASLEVEVDVNEGQIGAIRPGLAAVTVLDAYTDWDIPGTVIAIIPTANRDRATIQVRVSLDVEDPRILPEMAAKVTFERE